MREISLILASVKVLALDAALRAALSAKVYGLATYGADRPLSIWLDESASSADETAAREIAQAHDPVTLSVDKAIILADGVDVATVTVRAPKPGAAAVTLSVNGIDYPVMLADGVAVEPIMALDPTTITITIKNPANRSTDTLTIQAV
jgi:hypothetical protein